MDKLTFEQLVTKFNELMDDLEKSKEASKQEAPVSDMSYNTEDCNYKEPTKCNNSYCCSGCTEEDDSEELLMTPLEELISTRVANHLANGTFPSLEEAKAIYILDSLNYRYNS